MPSFIVVNLSIDGYFLPPGTVDTEQHLVDFLNGILNGSVQVGLAFRFTWRMTHVSSLKYETLNVVSSVSVREETASISASDASSSKSKAH